MRCYTGSNNPGAKHKDWEIHACCNLLETKPHLSLSVVARVTKVTVSTVRGIYKGRIWKHISCEYKFRA